MRLDLWQRKWKLERATTIRWQEELWGNQVPLINDILRRIQARSVRVKEKFEEFFQPGRQNVSKSEIIEFVRKLDEQGTTWVEDIKRWLGELAETADRAFRGKHGVTVSEELTEAQLQMVRSSTLMQMALGLRNISEGLYQSVGAAIASRPANKLIKLKVDLTGTMDGFRLESVQSQRSLQLIYHLFLQWDGSPHELCIEGPSNVEDLLQGAANVLSIPQESQESSILIDDGAESRFFRSRLPSQEERLFTPGGHDSSWVENAWWAPQSLAQFFVSLDSLDIISSQRIFPLSERMTLAFKIVESAVLLAGTSWLSNIRSDFLRRCPPSRGDNYNYTLDLSYSNYTIDPGALAVMTWKSVERLVGHILRVGVVLVEIGYGKRVVDYEFDMWGTTWGTIVISLHNVKGKVSIETVKGELTANMGSDYASMTTLCLGEIQQLSLELYWKGKSFGEIYKEILEVYFGKVYIPMCQRARYLQLMAGIAAGSRTKA
ncbi:hypothetical protein BKA61DRAFT_575197 [Leptodontidium sp. MPI-SDFR-AT-0119]|nr:hypothetical protein BKA61DRAFT_575197 [Leptodontidium sp. MPI-SDFR-AT-0119]